MSAPVVVIPPDPLQLAAGVLRRTGDDLIARARHVHAQAGSTILNGADPGFSPALFRGRTLSVRSCLTDAANEAFIDVECASRTVGQAVVADAVGASDAQAAGNTGPVGSAEAAGHAQVLSRARTVGGAAAALGIDAGRGSPVVGPDIPLNPIWYLEQLGQLATELDERLQFSAGACVGMCLNTAFQDGVLTTSVGAGLAYSLGADVTVKPIMSEEERTMDWEEHRIFGSVSWVGGELTKRVNDDGTTEQWTPSLLAGLSPLKAGGGWVYQWNRRDDVWNRSDDD